MKKKLISLTLICVLLFLLCGCNCGAPKHLPGEKEGDDQFVWVCEKPFAFFYLPDNHEEYYGFLKGYMERDSEFVCFYSAFNIIDGRAYFKEETAFLEDTDIYWDESFLGDGTYYKNKFYLHIEHDNINFFDGELPKLRFDKMTKEDFLERYGDIEAISEHLLELETYDPNKLPT